MLLSILFTYYFKIKKINHFTDWFNICLFYKKFEQKRRWRRHPDSNRGSEFCRLVPYHLAISPHFKMHIHESLSLPATRLRSMHTDVVTRFARTTSATWLYRHIIKCVLMNCFSYFIKISMEQVTRIGLVTKPWQGLVLPLNYTCIIYFTYF